MTTPLTDAQTIITTLRLVPHPIEGGFFRETYRASGTIAGEALPAGYARDASRSFGTAIYYLLTASTFSEMHRLPTEEVFHLYLGGPLRMLQLFGDGSGREIVLGKNILAGEEPQVVVPAGVWQGSLLEPGVEFALFGRDDGAGFRVRRLRARPPRVTREAVPPTRQANCATDTRDHLRDHHRTVRSLSQPTPFARSRPLRRLRTGTRADEIRSRQVWCDRRASSRSSAAARPNAPASRAGRARG